MVKAEDDKTQSGAAPKSQKPNPLPRIGRMVLCVLSMGMIYPNAFSESVDIADYESRSNRSSK